TTGNTGTLTLYVDGALASQISGFSLNTMAPASAGTAFGLMGQFGQTFTKGALASLQVFNDSAGTSSYNFNYGSGLGNTASATSGQNLSLVLDQIYGGTSQLYNFSGGTASASSNTSYM